MLLLVAAVMLLLTLPVIFVLPALHRVDDESARLQTMAAAASELGAATTANADGQAALLAFIASTSPTERAALLNRSVERAQYTRSVQEKLAATAGSDPAIRALWTQLHADWDTATAVSTTLAGTLMNSRPTRATGAAISRQLAAHGAVSDDLTALAGGYQKTVTGLSADCASPCARGARPAIDRLRRHGRGAPRVARRRIALRASLGAPGPATGSAVQAHRGRGPPATRVRDDRERARSDRGDPSCADELLGSISMPGCNSPTPAMRI